MNGMILALAEGRRPAFFCKLIRMKVTFPLNICRNKRLYSKCFIKPTHAKSDDEKMSDWNVPRFRWRTFTFANCSAKAGGGPLIVVGGLFSVFSLASRSFCILFCLCSSRASSTTFLLGLSWTSQINIFWGKIFYGKLFGMWDMNWGTKFLSILRHAEHQLRVVNIYFWFVIRGSTCRSKRMSAFRNSFVAPKADLIVALAWVEI